MTSLTPPAADLAPLVAHGLAVQVEDLPLPLSTFYIAAVIALVVSFAALTIGFRTHRPDRWAPHSPPRAVQVIARSRGIRTMLGVLALAWLVITVVAALWGSTETGDNAAPSLVFVLGWLGLPLAAVLLGRGVLALHPVAALARAGGMRASAGDDDEKHSSAQQPEPGTLGVWPAWAGLVAFTWLELVFPTSTHLMLLGGLVLVWVVTGLAMASRWGVTRWRDHLDPFGTYARLLASLSPWGTTSDGRIGLRLPMLGPNRDVPAEPGLVPLVTLLIGSVSYDGLTRTGWWAERVSLATADLASSGVSDTTARVLFGTLGYVLLLLIAWGAFELASWGAARVGRLSTDRVRAAQAFAPSLLPIALAYVVAHYFSFAVVQGQDLVRLASDPLGHGSDLFGTAGRTLRDVWRPSGATVWSVQVGAIVLGHVCGLLLAHDRALALAPRGEDGGADHRRATLSQLPMLCLMLLYTVGGLYFLSEGLS